MEEKKDDEEDKINFEKRPAILSQEIQEELRNPNGMFYCWCSRNSQPSCLMTTADLLIFSAVPSKKLEGGGEEQKLIHLKFLATLNNKGIAGPAAVKNSSWPIELS